MRKNGKPSSTRKNHDIMIKATMIRIFYSFSYINFEKKPFSY